ncbi:MAG: hypothetical protein V4685_09645 [Bacteroidota bacterium]
MAGEKSPHILNSSSNLLGFCLVVLTSIKISKFAAATFIDEITGLAAMMLMISCILSFLSIRSKSETGSEKLERVADIIFLVGLVSLAITIVLVSFNLFA